MKKVLLFLLALSIASLAISCKSSVSTSESRTFCDRNEFSRNGVDSVFAYYYSAKEGEINKDSKSLCEIQKYDSLGNIIYYKGSSFPSIPSPLSFYALHSQIEEQMKKIRGTKNNVFVYQLEYTDTVFRKAICYDKDGDYCARIEHYQNNNQMIDSIYVFGSLRYVRHIYQDTQGRDSIRIEYDDEYGSNLTLSTQCNTTYKPLNDSTVREYETFKNRDFRFKSNKQYNTFSYYTDLVYNANGKVISYFDDEGNPVYTYKYNEKGELTEETYHTGWGGEYISRYEYSESGLLLRVITYEDKTICSGCTEFEYTYR